MGAPKVLGEQAQTPFAGHELPDVLHATSYLPFVSTPSGHKTGEIAVATHSNLRNRRCDTETAHTHTHTLQFEVVTFCYYLNRSSRPVSVRRGLGTLVSGLKE